MRLTLPSIALGVLAITSPALASPLPAALQIEWEAPGECPELAVFETELAQQLPPEASQMQDPLTVVVNISKRAPSGYELRISTPVGERAPLSDKDCAVLVKTAALIVGMAIEVSALDEPPDEPAEQREDFERPEGGTVFETLPDVTTGTPVKIVDERPPVYLAMRANLGGDLGILPHPAPSAGLGMAIIRERFRLEATLATSPAQPAATERDPTVGAELSLTTIGVRGCYVVAPGDLSGALCAGGEIGRFQIDAFGLIPGQEMETDARWWAATGSVGVARKLWGPFSYRAEAGFVARPVRLVFTAPPPDDLPGVEIHTVPMLSARVMTGVEVRFR